VNERGITRPYGFGKALHIRVLNVEVEAPKNTTPTFRLGRGPAMKKGTKTCVTFGVKNIFICFYSLLGVLTTEKFMATINSSGIASPHVVRERQAAT
jgi:hypothetical protein